MQTAHCSLESTRCCDSSSYQHSQTIKTLKEKHNTTECSTQEDSVKILENTQEAYNARKPWGNTTHMKTKQLNGSQKHQIQKENESNIGAVWVQSCPGVLSTKSNPSPSFWKVSGKAFLVLAQEKKTSFEHFSFSVFLYFPGLVGKGRLVSNRLQYLLHIDIFDPSFDSFEMPTKVRQDSERVFSFSSEMRHWKRKTPWTCLNADDISEMNQCSQTHLDSVQ